MKNSLLVSYLAILFMFLPHSSLAKNLNFSFSNNVEWLAQQQLQPDSGAMSKKAASAKKAIADGQKKTKNLFKLIANAIKFKSNVREGQKKRVLDYVNAMGVKDSIAATSKNMQLLFNELSKKGQNQFDSLKILIDSIRQDTIDQANLPAGGFAVNDSIINLLADKIIPLLTAKDSETGEEKEKSEKVSAITELMNGDKEIHLQKMQGNVIRRYQLTITHARNIYGFCNEVTKPPPQLSFYDGIFYDAVSVNGSTGGISGSGGWYTSPVLTAFQQQGGRIYCSMLWENPKLYDQFLRNAEPQKQCADNILLLLKQRKASGVNLVFRNLSNKYKNDFTNFVGFLDSVLAIEDTAYRVFITLPPVDTENAYDLKNLKEFTEDFFIDFTPQKNAVFGPIAPLTGKQAGTIEFAVSAYSARNIPPSKLMLLLSYRGALWKQNAGKDFVPQDLMPYSYIRKQYTSGVMYDESDAGAYIDTISSKQLRRIWFDDENTLGKKYDFVLGNKLGGVGIRFVNDDVGYSELSDELAYKFLQPDTTFLADSDVVSKTDLSFLQNIGERLYLYRFILQHPCATCFEGFAENDSEVIVIDRYLSDLKIDSQIIADRKKGLKRHTWTNSSGTEISSYQKFDYVNDEMNRVLEYLTWFFLFITVLAAACYIYNIKQVGDNWKWKKKAAALLICLSGLLIIVTFTFLFTDDLIPIFGVSVRPSSASPCARDTKCINMPYFTLLSIIVISIGLGLLLFYYLFAPLLKKEDLP